MKASLLVMLLVAALAPSVFAGAVLRAGDPVEMRISGVPADEQTQVNNVYTVDSNGMVNMPYINKVRAEGLTPAQLASAIENGYKSAGIFTNPTITIVMQPQARFVNVGGAVRAPARVPFTEDMTLLAAIRSGKTRASIQNCSPATKSKCRRASSRSGSLPRLRPMAFVRLGVIRDDAKGNQDRNRWSGRL